MFIHLWHSLLHTRKHDRQWHINDIEEELKELKQEKHFWKCVSETSDVVYAYTRARWVGYTDIPWPLSKLDFIVGLAYMFPKYTLLWLFFYTAGKRVNRQVTVTEVRNPHKAHKVRAIAKRYGLHPEQFQEECKKLSRFWIFLK